MKTRKIILGILLALSLRLTALTAASPWTAVTPAPDNVQSMMLLSDGTVMAQDGTGTNWFRLTPDAKGHYFDGVWTTNDIKPMNYTRLYFASDVLPNGKVFVAGAEDSGTNAATDGSPWVEIYDPVANTWTDYGPAPFGGMADAESVVLNNGQVLVEPQAETNNGYSTYIFNPSGGTWSAPITPLNVQWESSWVKLPNDHILTVDSGGQHAGAFTSEEFVPSSGAWTNASAAPLPVSVWGYLPHDVAETGPAFLLPNGNAFFLGGSGHTAIYQFATSTWIPGPDIPGGQVASDAPAAMMANGKILTCVGPPLDASNSYDWTSPISFYEYDYSAGSIGAFTPVISPNTNYTSRAVTYICRMLDLPDGTVLFTDSGSQLYVYQPDSGPIATGRPAVDSVSWNSDGSLHLSGTLFNGISEGAAYGDDQQMATDFPIVSFTNSAGHVAYGRTYNWSSTSVQTGSRIVTTECAPPAGMLTQPGPFSLQVIANGNASNPFTFNGPVWVDFNYTSALNYYFGTYEFPYDTLADGVAAVDSGGTIALNGNVQPSVSPETMTISKPMHIISVNGPSTIGR